MSSVSREFPGEDLCAIRRVCNCRWIRSERRFGSVKTHQPVLAHEPPNSCWSGHGGKGSLRTTLRCEVDSGKWFPPCSREPRSSAPDRIKTSPVFVVARDTFGGLAADARNAQIPAQPRTARFRCQCCRRDLVEVGNHYAPVAEAIGTTNRR